MGTIKKGRRQRAGNDQIYEFSQIPTLKECKQSNRVQKDIKAVNVIKSIGQLGSWFVRYVLNGLYFSKERS